MPLTALVERIVATQQMLAMTLLLTMSTKKFHANLCSIVVPVRNSVIISDEDQSGVFEDIQLTKRLQLHMIPKKYAVRTTENTNY